MDDVKRRQAKYAVTRTCSLGVLTMGDNLCTTCPPGLYAARFDSGEVETVTSRKTGAEYFRLALRFRLAAGPYRHGPEGWTPAGQSYAGRLVALWHELDTINGAPSLSPNAWFASPILSSPGRTLDERIRAWGARVRWVAVQRKSDRNPAKVAGVACADEGPEVEWVRSVCGDDSA